MPTLQTEQVMQARQLNLLNLKSLVLREENFMIRKWWKKCYIWHCGNKSDLYKEEAIPEKEAREFSQIVNAIFALTSAQNNSGVNQLFEGWFW
jgi:GTPase SAR1 family protein